VVLRVVAFAAVYRAHSTVPENRDDPVGPDAGADQAVAMGFKQRFGGVADGVQQRIFAPRIRRQQRLDRCAQLPISPAGSRQISFPLGATGVEKLLE
jgi:hypothetical protein